MENKKKKFSLKPILVTAVMVALGFALGLVIAEKALVKDEPFIYFAVMLISLFAVFILQIIIHEGGHLVFGLISGYKFLSFRLGSLMLVKAQNKFKLKKLTIAGTGGQCLLSPPEMKNGKIPVILYNLGGSIMNLISAVMFFILGAVTSDAEILPHIMNVAAAVGVGYALMNGIPLHLGTMDNDGQNAVSLSKSNAALRAFWIQLKVNELTTNGIRLKDMPVEWFTLPSEEEEKNPMTATLGVLACNRLMDEHDFANAEALMEKYLSGNFAAVGLHKNLMKCDLIYCAAIKDVPEKEKAEKLLDKEQISIMKAMGNYPSVLRTQYAYELLILKNVEKALSIRKKFDKTVKSYPTPADTESEMELFEIADTKAIMPLD